MVWGSEDKGSIMEPDDLTAEERELITLFRSIAKDSKRRRSALIWLQILSESEPWTAGEDGSSGEPLTTEQEP